MGMTSDDPGPGQRYAIAARKHIAELRRKEPGIRIEIRWCPSHCGVEGNEIADEWAKQAANEPDARGVEWHRYIRYIGRCGRKSTPTCSLAHIKRSEAKWADASKWVKAQLARTSNRKYRPSDKQKPNVAVAQANKKLAAKSRRGTTGQYVLWTTRRPDAKCWWCNYKTQTREHLFKNCPQRESQ